MKRRDFIARIEQTGCVFIAHGGRHDWYQNPITKVCQPVSRHREISEHLVKPILKMLAGG